MSTVTVCECMNQYELVMKTHSQFIFIEDLVFDLVSSVVKQLTQFHRDLRPVNANVLVALAKRSGPLPSLIEHLVVQISHKAFN